MEVQEKEVVKYKTVCCNCHGEFDFPEDDILTELDFTCAFDNIWLKSVRCPLCWTKNNLKAKRRNGHVDIIQSADRS